MKYLRGRLIIAKCNILDQDIWSSFETYQQHFYRFAYLAFDFIKIIFVKTQLAFGLFLQNRDSYDVCN